MIHHYQLGIIWNVSIVQHGQINHYDRSHEWNNEIKSIIMNISIDAEIAFDKIQCHS